MAEAGADPPLSRWKGSPPSAWWRSSPRSGRTIACCGRSGTISARAVRSRHPDRLSRFPRARGRSGPRGGHQGALLHRAAALGLAAGPGAAARGGGGPAGGGAAVRADASSASSGFEASTWATRWSTAGPGPAAEPARAQLGIAAGQPGARHLSREPGRRRSAGSGCRSETPRSSCCARAAAIGCWWREQPTASIPIPGPIEILRGNPVPLFAAADAALAKSGTTTLEAALADTPMVVAYKVHPLTWAMFQRLRTVRWVSLVNLVAEREVVPELLQDQRRGGPAGRGAAAAARPARPRAPWRSGKDSRWCGSGWASRAPRLGWWRWRTSCWARATEDSAGRGAGARRAGRPGARHHLAHHDRARGALAAAVPRQRRPHVFLLWHEALLPLLWQHRRQGIAIVVSEARDGQYLADLAPSLGYRAVRGSSTRGGARALLGAVRELQAGRCGRLHAGWAAGPSPRAQAGGGRGGAAGRGHRRADPRRGRAGLAITFLGPVHDPEAGWPGCGSPTGARSRWTPARPGSPTGTGGRGGATARDRGERRMSATGRYPSGSALAVDQPAAGRAAGPPGAPAGLGALARRPWRPGETAYRRGWLAVHDLPLPIGRGGQSHRRRLRQDPDRHLDRPALRGARASRPGSCCAATAATRRWCTSTRCPKRSWWPIPTGRRAPSARWRRGAEVLVLDDAYQRLDVRRDLNVAVMSAETTRAVRWPLPRGPWREGLGRARPGGRA